MVVDAGHHNAPFVAQLLPSVFSQSWDTVGISTRANALRKIFSYTRKTEMVPFAPKIRNSLGGSEAIVSLRAGNPFTQAFRRAWAGTERVFFHWNR